MQQDSPGNKPNPSRNERYRVVAQPKLLSVSKARKKADKFAANDDKKARVGAKKAIVHELSSQLAIKAQGLQLGARNEPGKNPYGSEKLDNKKVMRNKSTGKRIVSREAGKGKEARNIVQPQQKSKPPGYIWDVNGRPEELRIRFLARKYLALWRRGTYGNISPSEARAHYEGVLKRHALRVWQDIWWSGRKGWKLNIRAEYHNRYRMWQKIFRAWRLFMMVSRAKKAKYKLADQYVHGVLLLKCVKGWRQCVERRRLKHLQQKIADHQAITWVKRRVWHQWKHQLSVKHKESLMEQRALHFWAFNLVAKTWTVWYSALQYQYEDKAKLLMAKRHSNQKLITMVWIAWKNYRATRKLKSIQRRVAERHYNTALARRSLDVWVQRKHRQVQLAQFEDLIAYKGCVARARRALNHWKFYIWMQHQEYQKERQAEEHYRKHLLKTCLSSIHLQVIERRLKEMRKQMAAKAWYKLQLRRVWHVWMKRCEHSEELRLYTLTKKARRHYSHMLQYKCVRVWVKYCEWRRYRHIQYHMADGHYKQTALPRYFLRLQAFVDLMHERKENKEASEKFRREVLYAQGFYKWRAAYHLQLDLRMMNRMAILHHDEVIKRQFLRHWLQKARDRLNMNKLQDIADDHHNQHIVSESMAKWKDFVREVKSSRSSHHTAVHHYYVRLLRWTWSAWTQYVQRRQVKWHKRASADVHYSQCITGKVLKAWKVYHSCATQAQCRAEELYQACTTKRMRELFCKWREYTVEHKQKRHAHHLARRIWKRSLVAKVFSSWRNYAAQHAVKSEEKYIRLQELRKTLDKSKLRRALLAWDSHTKTSTIQRSLYQIAVSHHRRGVLCRSVAAWIAYTKLQFRVQILHRQSMWLHNRRITATFFKKWKEQFSVSLEIRRKSTLALWNWSVTLQRQVFYAWLQYAITRKRKEVRIAQALDQRRTRLLRIGTTKWMKVAFHLASERNRFAQARLLDEARGVQQCVYRCAMHWRRWAADRARRRGDSPRFRQLSPSKQVARNRHAQRPAPYVDTDLFSSQPDHSSSKLPPDLFRSRPRPRVPDYLRESYDVTQIAIATDKQPLPSYPHPTLGAHGAQNSLKGQNLTKPGTSGQDSETEEDIPRSAPPLPSPRPRLTMHPKGRSPGEESILFPPSSEGEGESYISSRGTAVPDRHSRQLKDTRANSGQGDIKKISPTRAARPVLLPPSSFALQKTKATAVISKDSCSRTTRLTFPPATRKENSAGSSDTAPESSPDHSDASMSESDSDDNEDNNDASRPVPPLLSDTQLQNQILAARDRLQDYHNLKIKHREKICQREELERVVRYQREGNDYWEEQEELRNAEQLLAEITEETNILKKKIEEDRPQVEKLALSINELISRAGLPKV